MHIRTLQQAAEAFGERLRGIREAAPQIRWYHGDILSNVEALAGLLKRGHEDIFGQFAGGTVADIGAADGDLAFFLESQGFDCDIIDCPATSYDGLASARHLKQALNSAVAIHEIDLDGRFELPRSYDAVIALGLLYHLKNPFYFLETIAEQARYCLLSTRITRWLSSGRWPWQREVSVRHAPLAYLLGPGECNDDATNFWIFSEAGLRRIAERAGWEILAYRSYGDHLASNPRDREHDERGFMLLHSRHLG